MRRFRFALEGYLKYKKMIEEQKLSELQAITAKRVEYEQDIEKSRLEMERILNEERKEAKEGDYFNLNLALLRRQYLASLQQKAQISQKKLAAIQEEWEQKKLAWQKAKLEKMAIEKWRERQYQSYLYELTREEIKDLDEFNLNQKHKGGRHYVENSKSPNLI